MRYADVLLVYASAVQLRRDRVLTLKNPPSVRAVRFKSLSADKDGLFLLDDLEELIRRTAEED